MKLLSAEFLKLKGTLTYYLPLVLAVLACSVVGTSLVFDAHYSVRLGESPWDRLTHGGLLIYVVMLYNPFQILLIGLVFYIEQRANSLKLLFVQPVSRSSQYFYKLGALLIITFSASLFMLVGLLVTGYVVDFWTPEFGFAFVSPDWRKMVRILLYCAISGLGVLGVQHLLSLRFGNILVAPAIGILGFILAFALVGTGSRFALYLPYAYPLVAPDLELFPFDYQTYSFAGLSNAELFSLGWFIITVFLGHVYTRNRKVLN